MARDEPNCQALPRPKKAPLGSKRRVRGDKIWGLLEASKALTSSLELERVLQIIVQRLGALFPLADAGFVALREEDSDWIRVIASFGYGPCIRRIATRIDPKSAGVPGRVFGQRKPVLVAGVEAVKAVVDDMELPDQALIYKAIKGRSLGSSVICAPFYVRNRFLGAIQLEHFRNLNQVFTVEDLTLLEVLCDHIAIAVDNAMLYRKLKAQEQLSHELLGKIIQAQEEERQRVARELHDDVNQMLISLLLDLQSLKEDYVQTNVVPAQVIAKINHLQKTINGAMERTRYMSYSLRPSALDDLGLPMALDWYVRMYLAGSPIPIRLNIKLEERLDPLIETTLFRVAQEALTNAIRYSQANQITVQLYRTRRQGENVVRLVISDDGLGFDLQATYNATKPHRCLGLHGMAERVNLVGGKFELRSRPGAGTRVAAEIKC